MSTNIPLSQSQDGQFLGHMYKNLTSYHSVGLQSQIYRVLPSHPLTFPFWPVLPTLAYLLRCLLEKQRLFLFQEPLCPL